MSTHTQTIEGREWTVEVLDRVERPATEWGTPNNCTTYRDFEQAAMVTIYMDGEPVLPEQPVVGVDAYPAGWDIPTGELFNQTYLDMSRCRPGGGNYLDRKARIVAAQFGVGPDYDHSDRETMREAVVRAAHEQRVIAGSCPDCGGLTEDMGDYVDCGDCGWSNADSYHRG